MVGRWLLFHVLLLIPEPGQSWILLPEREAKQHTHQVDVKISANINKNHLQSGVVAFRNLKAELQSLNGSLVFRPG